MTYRSNANIVFSCHYHIVWCPKYRRKVLTGDVEKRLKEIVREVAEELRVVIVEMETDRDHIHILADVDPQFGVAAFIRKAKGRSSRLLRKEFPHLRTKLPSLWTNSYFVTTVGGAPLSIVKQYIENQQTSERPKEKAKWRSYIDGIGAAS